MSPRRRRATARGPAVVLLLALPATTVSACGSPEDDAVRSAASRFQTDLARSDGADACRVLAARTVSDLEQSTGRPCAEAILDEDLPHPTEPTEINVYGSAAQVRYDGDVLFLSRFEGGWLITAAGCTAGPNGVYDCRVEAG